MSPLSRFLRKLPNLIAAVILLQTLFFKFTAAPESVHIFSTLSLEPIGRIGSGVAELIAALLLLWPAWAWAGAALALGIMGGAILSHLTVLGLEVQEDGGQLFLLALLVAVLAGLILVRDRALARAFLERKRDGSRHGV